MDITTAAGTRVTQPFGSQLHASDYVAHGVPSIMPQNIGDNRVVRDGIARISAGDAERLSRYLVRPGDIVYSRRGDVERRALIRPQEDGWLCGTGCLRVRFGEGTSGARKGHLVAPWVREAIERALQDHRSSDALDELSQLGAPTGDLDQMLAEIDAGRG